MITKIQKMRERILVFLAHDMGLPYFKLTRKRPPFPYTQPHLHSLPQGFIGNELAMFLTKNNLELLPYYEKHDIKHVVLDYPPTEEGEICLQVFMLANGRITFPVLVTVLFGIITMPEYYSSFLKAWKAGKKCTSLKDLDWYGLMSLPLGFVRNEIFNKRNASLSGLIISYTKSKR